MGLSTEYRGYSIRYSENEDKWTCYDVGASNERLSRVKAKIDSMHAKLRKENAFHCLDVSTHGGVRAVEATIVEYLEPIRKRESFERKGTGEVIDHKVAYMSNRTSVSNRRSRQTGSLSSLVLISDEARKQIDTASKLYAQAKEIERQARDIISNLPRPTIDDIAPLVSASAHHFDELEQSGV